MPLSVANIQTALAYRLGEDSGQASTSAAGQQRLEWINQGYFDIARRADWWWLEGLDTNNTNTGATSYPEPADLKAFKELKIGNIYFDQIPEENSRVYRSNTVIVTIPYLIRAFKFYRFGGSYYLIPTDDADGLTHEIRYYKRVTKRAADADTFLIPDEYLDALAMYAEGRYWLSISQQTKAVVPFQEFEDVIAHMQKENGRRYNGFSILDPEEAF